jgi:cytochrome c5
MILAQSVASAQDPNLASREVMDQYRAVTIAPQSLRQLPVPPPDAALANARPAAVPSSRRQAQQVAQVTAPAPASGAAAASTGANQPAKAAATGGADAALIARGNTAFQSACTQCHDAERSTTKAKDLPGWRATVRRMAGKSGADVPQGDWEAIATYLASLSAPAAAGGAATAAGAGAGAAAAAATPEQQFSLWATFSPYWREGNDHMEYPGFFPQTWVGANWQGSGPLSARVTACVTCHTEPGNAHRIELVEAALRVDLVNLICHRDSPIKAIVDAGRFVVPFGAFSAQVNPGVYRTVAKPLIFTMGQRVFPGDLGDPVLPMPYADQGANYNMLVPLHDKITATLDAYVVNGLRGSSTGIDFFASRNYVAGNKEPAIGTRATLGNQFVRLGGSLTAGRFNDDSGSGPHNQGLYYRIYGFDLTARYENLLRFQIEYADRDNDRVVSLPGQLVAREHVGGMYMEGEVRLKKKSKFSFLMRYDLLDHRSVLPPPGSVLTTGRFDVKRTTVGINYQLAGNSLLMVNYERWILPGPLPDLNVYGVRWAATF